jgi:hypothetical protein
MDEDMNTECPFDAALEKMLIPMMQTVFHGEDMPPADRFDRWCEMASRVLMPGRAFMEHTEDFQGTYLAWVASWLRLWGVRDLRIFPRGRAIFGRGRWLIDTCRVGMT